MVPEVVGTGGLSRYSTPQSLRLLPLMCACRSVALVGCLCGFDRQLRGGDIGTADAASESAERVGLSPQSSLGTAAPFPSPADA